jgi:predicted nucleic acid-binding protein
VAALTRYLADKSALVRFDHPRLDARWLVSMQDGAIGTCDIVDLEVLYSARSLADYEITLLRRSSLPSVPITPDVTGRAIEVQHDLARTGHHRVPIPDLLVAAAAESGGLTVLHYDRDYEVIAGVTGQPHEWIAPRGSL